jgi:hypothetical protein
MTDALFSAECAASFSQTIRLPAALSASVKDSRAFFAVCLCICFLTRKSMLMDSPDQKSCLIKKL